MIWNLGSINIDNFYDLPHLPKAGETQSASRYSQGLGGKGANQSIAAARGGARVMHIGALGDDAPWIKTRLLEYGVDVEHIATLPGATGHANVYVDAVGENSIVLLPGANALITNEMIGAALTEATPGDTLLLQNETVGQAYAVETAKTLGMTVAYAAAPFDVASVRALLGKIDLLLLNAVEAEQLRSELSVELTDLGVPDVIVTLGSDGCKWVSNKGESSFPAYKAEPVDTTGAGDTFTGFLVAGLDRGLTISEAIDVAQKAAALMVERRGTGDVIPDLKEVQDRFGV